MRSARRLVVIGGLLNSRGNANSPNMRAVGSGQVRPYCDGSFRRDAGTCTLGFTSSTLARLSAIEAQSTPLDSGSGKEMIGQRWKREDIDSTDELLATADAVRVRHDRPDGQGAGPN